MKKIAALLCLALCLASCGDTSAIDKAISAHETSSTEETTTTTTAQTAEPTLDDAAKLMEGSDYDVDLTVLDSNLCYAQVYDMVYNPDMYLGKSVRMRGNMAYFKDENTGQEYFAVLIQDALQCCSQGIEFKLTGEHKYPDDYPELGTIITVTGTFNSYEEDGMGYIQLIDAEMAVS